MIYTENRYSGLRKKSQIPNRLYSFNILYYVNDVPNKERSNEDEIVPANVQGFAKVGQ